MEILSETGHIDGDPRPITHPVKFFEKGDKPLEIVTTRQWYITSTINGWHCYEKFYWRAGAPNVGIPGLWFAPRTDSKVGQRLVDSHQRYFRRPLPLSVPALDADANPSPDDRSVGRPITIDHRAAFPTASRGSRRRPVISS